jgi:hypothetical protein
MKKILLVSILIISLPLTVACNSISNADTVSGELSTPLVNSIVVEDSNANNAAAANNASTVNAILSEEEISDLLFMREEEKLAHDVYSYLYEQWGMNVFQNIANSEQTHTTSVLALLNQYGISDPVEGLNTGQFHNTDLQDLYNQLTAQGSVSLADAIKVGAAIEEIDILDLQEAQTHTGQADILLVYENLLQGSYNHLRAFANTLRQQTGETYQPQYLSPEEYQAIIDGTMGSGMGNSSQGQPGGKGQGNPNRN